VVCRLRLASTAFIPRLTLSFLKKDLSGPDMGHCSPRFDLTCSAIRCFRNASVTCLVWAIVAQWTFHFWGNAFVITVITLPWKRLLRTRYNTFKLYYKSYCRILRKVIREAKRLHCNKLITSAKNRTKTSWHIIDRETGCKSNNNKDTTRNIPIS
jgi:hypothetical protein